MSTKATAGTEESTGFPSIANPNENGEMTKLIAVPFLVIAGIVGLIALLKGLQRLHSMLFGPRYFGD